MKRIHLNPPELPDWSTMFSQIVIAEGSPMRVVVLSGQVGVDAQQNIAGDGSYDAQVAQSFANLQTAISAAQCSVTDVAKLTIYVVDYKYEMVNAIRDAIQRAFGSHPLPACTLVGVQALGRPEFLIEVEALLIAAASKEN
jgi:enamine deaminase RidA (YjgF/YER057c/UK114 family)